MKKELDKLLETFNYDLIEIKEDLTKEVINKLANLFFTCFLINRKQNEEFYKYTQNIFEKKLDELKIDLERLVL